jgi:putative membrane protein
LVIVGNQFTNDERERIRDAIKTAESRTAAAFNLVVVGASDRYPLFPLVWAALGAVLAACFIAIVRPATAVRIALVIQLLVLIGLTLLFDRMPIRLWLVPDRIKRARAEHLAHREFAAHVEGGGTQRHRILLFVSLGERYVEIIADHETHALVPPGTWDKIVADFVAAVKAGRVADGILAAIQSCGAVLETHHPAGVHERA